jgi:hypothetical protein
MSVSKTPPAETKSVTPSKFDLKLHLEIIDVSRGTSLFQKLTGKKMGAGALDRDEAI